jgi:hypothetical protein
VRDVSLRIARLGSILGQGDAEAHRLEAQISRLRQRPGVVQLLELGAIFLADGRLALVRLVARP